MGCLGDDDMVRDATIEEMSQAVFSVSPLGGHGGYIIRPTKLNSVQLRLRVVQSAVGDSRGKKLAGEDLTCD
jgi:hypothetical protein